ncbi:sugar ABC transporter permease YjfF, partial [Candidatus Sumerlaeota bacterium]
MKFALDRKHIPLLATAATLVALYAAASIYLRDSNFFSSYVFLNLFRDNASVGIAAIGMTF